MSKRSLTRLSQMLVVGTWVSLIVPVSAVGQGSIAFNGTNSSTATSGTSKLEHTTANVLNNVQQVTVCCWIYIGGSGENGLGRVIYLDEQAGNAAFSIRHNGTGTLLVSKRAGAAGTDGAWNFPVVEGAWNAVCVRLNFSADNAPTARVNFTTATVSQVGPTAVGIQDQPATGYCVGNNSAQTQTWDGLIAHIQVFNAILSDANADAALRAPGSYTTGLRLYLPMSKATDVFDRSGNGFHGTGTDLSNGADRPASHRIFKFGAVDQLQDKIVIPSFGSEPAPSVRGLGVGTKLTPLVTLTGGARFITTEGWGASSVIKPTVRDVYADGNQNIPIHPFGNSTELALGDNPICHGIDIDGDGAEVTGCKVFDFRGDGIRVNNSTAETSPLIRIPRVRDNKVSHCWTGIRAAAVDAHITGNRVANTRDYGIRCLGGSEQLWGNHVFGSQVAISAEGGFVQSTNDRFADAPVGFQILSGASNSIITNGTAIHCWNQSIMSKAQRVNISNCFIDVPNTDTVNHPGEAGDTRTKIVGIWLHWNGNQNVVDNCFVRIGQHTFPGDTNLTGSIGVYVQQHNARVRGLRVVGSPRAGEVGCLISPGRNAINNEVDSTGAPNFPGNGFRDTGDAVVEFENNMANELANTSGEVRVTYSPGEIPVRIPAGSPTPWGQNGKLKIYTRESTSGTWTELNAGQAYP